MKYSQPISRSPLAGFYAVCLAALPLAAAPLDDFAAAIERDLAWRCVGAGYAIYQNGNPVRSGGVGVAEVGDPDNVFDAGLPFTANTVKDAHSISKTITAVAMMRALAQTLNVTEESPFWPYLPADLQNAVSPDQVPAMQALRFRDLLEHRSGFGGSNAFAWSQIRSQMTNTTLVSPNPRTFVYGNINYALCRVLIPYVRDLSGFRSLEAVATLAHLDAATSAFYADYVREQVFDRAGINGSSIHPRPVTATLPHFARYYNHEKPADEGMLMTDRRLTVGSGGWAISAMDYGRFISALFRGDLLAPGDLASLMNQRMGMFAVNGSNNSDIYYTHNGSTTAATGVGGRSAWMSFPNDIHVVVQVNSLRNAYWGPGIRLDQIVREAYEHAFSVAPSSFSFPRHLFFHRAGDGWMVSRGISGDGTLGARNFDYDFRNGAPQLFTHHRFFGIDNQAFLLRYSASAPNGKGRAVMHRVKGDGTLDGTVFDNDGWLAGYSHVETFDTWQGTFLLLHNQSNGRIRTLPITPLGNLSAAVTDNIYTTGFDVLKILVLDGTSHLLRHNSTTGQTHLRALNDDGSVGATVYDANWTTGFTLFESFTAGGDTFLFRYNPLAGKARINRIVGAFSSLPVVLDQDNWLSGWQRIRFFRTGNQTYFLRYNPATGASRMQRINADGTLGSLVSSSDNWLTATLGTGIFNPPQTGWTDLEIYDATPGFSSPDLGIGPPPPIMGVEFGPSIEPSFQVPDDLDPIVAVPFQPAITSLSGEIEIHWPAQKGLLYVFEQSADLRTWDAASVVTGEDRTFTLPALRDPASGELPDAGFYRFRTFEDIPPLPGERLSPPTEGE